MIYRGSTPTHTFVFPFELKNITNMYITYRQNGKNIVQKSFETDFESFAADLKNKEVSIALSQEDTLAFSCGEKYTDNIVEIQIRVLLDSGSVIISDPAHDRICDTATDFVIYDTDKRLSDTVMIYDGGDVGN